MESTQAETKRQLQINQVKIWLSGLCCLCCNSVLDGGQNMKNTLTVFAVICSLLICALVAFYFVSPLHQVSVLQSENNVLRAQMASLQADNTADILTIAVAGMLLITALVLAAFFLFLCLLGNIRPCDFFSIRQHNTRQWITQDNTVKCKDNTGQMITQYDTGQYDSTEYYYDRDDRYMMEVQG